MQGRHKPAQVLVWLGSDSCTYKIPILRVFTVITSFPSYFKTSTQHYDTLEASRKKKILRQLTQIRCLWCKNNIAAPPFIPLCVPEHQFNLMILAKICSKFWTRINFLNSYDACLHLFVLKPS